MGESLIVDNDEAVFLARELADRQGTSVDRAVVDALRGTLARTAAREHPVPEPVRLGPLEAMTREQRERYDRLRELSEQCAPFRIPGATSDHSDFYDEHGLPI